MKLHHVLRAALLLVSTLVLGACTSSDGYYASGAYPSSYYGVYGDYTYPYGRYGYNSCCYSDYNRDPERREQIETRRENRPNSSRAQAASARAQSMGKPSPSSMSRPTRAPRGGGRR